jgi:hypothetical protein
MQKSELVLIRDFRPDDLNFVMASWLRGLYYGCSWFNQVPKDIFMHCYHAVITALLPLTRVRVACLKDDPDTILGYSVCGRSDTTIHWVFVKDRWRNIGIARSLVPDTVRSATHMTKVGLSLLKGHPAIVFNPFLIP